MKIKNDTNLPEAIVRAAMEDRYSRGEADISVTSLIDAPRQFIMQQAYTGEMAPEIDVAKRLWPLLGTAFHNLMDADINPNVIKEERLFMERNGWTISGAIDRQVKRGHKVDIEDFKVTSVYTYIGAEKGEKDDWRNQLNMYANLVEANGRQVRKLYIIALLRDWRPMEAKTKSGYPKTPIMRLEIPLMKKRDRTFYMDQRIEMHQDAQATWDKMGKIVDCTAEERWYNGESFAVMKAGAKRATRVFEREDEAKLYAARLGGPFSVEHRPGSNRRCEEYCDFSELCGQWRRMKEDVIVDAVMEKLDG